MQDFAANRYVLNESVLTMNPRSSESVGAHGRPFLVISTDPYASMWATPRPDGVLL